MIELGKREKRWELFTIALGLIGTIGCFLLTFPMQYSLGSLIIVLSIFTLLIYHAYTLEAPRKRLFIIMFAYMLLMILTAQIWIKAIPYIVNTILQVYEDHSQYRFQKLDTSISTDQMSFAVSVALLVIWIPMSALIVRSIRKKHSFFLAFFITVPFIGAILLFTLRPPTVYFLMLMTYYFMLYGMANTGSQSKNHNYIHNGICLGICAIVLMMGMRFLVRETTYIRDQHVENLRTRIQITIRDILQGTIQSETLGEVDLAQAGNRVYIYSDDMKVEMEEPRSLYLHAFSASLYKDNTWKQMSDEHYQMLYDLQGKLSVHPFAFVRENAKGILAEDDLKEVTITNLHADDRYLYVPYNVNDDLSSMEIVQDAYIDGSESEDPYTYHIWDQTQLAKLPEYDAVNAYTEKFSSAYLEIPYTIRSDLADIEIPDMEYAQTREAKIAAIQNYMLQFGTYTLTPGTTPQNEDFVVYFLKERKRGYCVHYASAAVLLLRYYGIEARYASGYYVSAANFNNGSAMVKDTQAHAWVEVLDPTKGWSVLEVTPASSQPTYQLNGNEPTTQPNQPTTNGQTPSNNQTPNQTQTPQGNTPQTNTTKTKGSLSSMVVIVLILCGILMILPLRRYIIHYRRYRKMHDEDINKAIIACGEYVSHLGVSYEQMTENIRSIWEEAKFSNHEMHLDQKAQMLAYCDKIKIQKQREYKFLQRLYARYIRCIF